jgi:RNA polymerase sigma-70 factor (ECF subfamily)
MQNDVAEERELVRAMCAGDEAAFDRFFRGYAPRVYRFVYSRVGRDPHVTEELCQEVMSQAMQNISRWRGEAGLFTWLCQMARNGAIDHWRRRARRARVEVPLDEDVAAAVASIPADESNRPDEQVSREELLVRVRDSLDRLPPNYASALEWKYLEGCSVAEIGIRLGINAVATQSLLARARQSLKGALASSTAGSLDDVLPFPRGVKS